MEPLGAKRMGAHIPEKLKSFGSGIRRDCGRRPVGDAMKNVTLRNASHSEAATNLSQRPGDQDPAVRAIAIQIFRQLRVNNNMAIITGGGSVHEMQDAITCAQRKADVRSGIKPASVA